MVWIILFVKVSFVGYNEPMKNKTRGFTLIELLVVLSIISLLSSVVLANLNATREKARVAALLQSEANYRHAYGDRLVTEWNFNSSNNDTGGNGLNMTLGGSPGYVQGVSGMALDLSANNDSAQTIQSSKFSLESGGAIECWFYPKSIVGGAGAIVNFETGATPFRPGIYLDSNLSLNVGWNGGTNGGVKFGGNGNWHTSKTYVIEKNKWHHVIFSWTPNYYWIYVDNVLKESGTLADITGTQTSPTPPQVRVGADSGNNFNGYVQNVRIYDQSLF
jgi:prepilin-type N-terminal cleavage/methylation domain-containing protein